MNKPTKKLFVLVITLSFSLFLTGTAYAASIVSLELEGEWHIQYEYLGDGANPVPFSVPMLFTTTLSFDISNPSSWYIEPGQSHITEFGNPSMQTTVNNYGPDNLFDHSSFSSFTMLSRHDYSEISADPDPFQSFQFVNRDYAQVVDETSTHNWSYGLEFHSPNQVISIEELRLATGDEFFSILLNAQENSVPFYTSFWKYTFETPALYGPPVNYTGGIGLSGFAFITNLTPHPIPEPSTLILFGAGLAGFVFRKRLNRS